MNRRGRLVLGVLCLFFLLVIIPFNNALSQSAPKKTVKIGCSLPLNISFGTEIKRALDVSVDMVNREGGVTVGKEAYKVELIVYDNKFKPEPGLAAIQRLVNIDKVRGLVGENSSAAILAGMAVAQQSGLPFITSAHSDRVLDPKFKYVYTTATARSVDVLYPLLLKARPEIKTAVIAAQDDEPGHDMTRRSSIILGHLKVKVLESLYFPRDMRDYTPVATKVASLKPDLFAIPGFGGTAEKQGLMSKTLYDTDWRGATFVTASPVAKDLIEICPRGEADGLYLPLADFTVLPDPPPLAVKLRKAFEQKFGGWRESGASWTLPFWFWVAAVKKGDSFDAARIDKALTALEVETPIGPAKMIKRPDLGNARYVDTMVTPVLAQLKGNKVVSVTSMTARAGIRELERFYGFNGQWE